MNLKWYEYYEEKGFGIARIWIAARTTQQPDGRVTREKNDMEVFPFYCLAIDNLDQNLVFAMEIMALTIDYTAKGPS